MNKMLAEEFLTDWWSEIAAKLQSSFHCRISMSAGFTLRWHVLEFLSWNFFWTQFSLAGWWSITAMKSQCSLSFRRSGALAWDCDDKCLNFYHEHNIDRIILAGWCLKIVMKLQYILRSVGLGVLDLECDDNSWYLYREKKYCLNSFRLSDDLK